MIDEHLILYLTDWCSALILINSFRLTFIDRSCLCFKPLLVILLFTWSKEPLIWFIKLWIFKQSWLIHRLEFFDFFFNVMVSHWLIFTCKFWVFEILEAISKRVFLLFRRRWLNFKVFSDQSFNSLILDVSTIVSHLF